MTPDRPGPAVREVLPPDTHLAFPAMAALRPSLGSVDAFVRHVDDIQRPEGYRLAVSETDGGPPGAAAGFRVLTTLAWGRSLYVDDLSTVPDARRAGHGAALLAWLLAEARRQGCAQVHLDSNVGPHRADAHRLYLNAGLAVTSLHFATKLPAAAAAAPDLPG